MAFHLFSSGSIQNSGKSVTQRKSQISADRRELSEFRRCAAAGGRELHRRFPICPRAKKMQSPSSIFSFDCSAAFSASEKNFTMGDFHSPFSILMKASPFRAVQLRDFS